MRQEVSAHELHGEKKTIGVFAYRGVGGKEEEEEEG